MGINPSRVLKPRNVLHKKVLAYTQHPAYTPKNLSWFMCYFNADKNSMQNSLDYLVFKRFLKQLPSGQYAVDRDVRPRITGTLCAVKDKFYILPDIGFADKYVIAVAFGDLLGACLGDRVRVALHTSDAEDETGVLFGVVEEIIAPLSDWFCGELKKDGQRFLVVPDREWRSRGVEVQESGNVQDVGAFMYAKMIGSAARRSEALHRASIRQQKGTLFTRVSDDAREKTEQEQSGLLQCRLVRQVSPLRSDRFLTENRFTTDLPKDAKVEALYTAKRGNYKRVEFCDRAICMVNTQLAFHMEKKGTEYCLYVHVPDITEDILPGSALDKALRYKGFLAGLVPEEIRNRLSFGLKTKARSFTAELLISRLGKVSCVGFYRSRIMCTTRKPSGAYTKIKGFLPKDCGREHLVQKAAETALAAYFSGKEAPFLKVLLTQEAEIYASALKNPEFLKRNDGDTEMPGEAIREQMRLCALDINAENNAISVPFANPFDNYAAILTQQTMLFYLQKHHNKEERKQFSDYLKESLAVCSRQGQCLWEYKILKRKENWMKKHDADGSSLHTGIVLGFVPDGDRALPATAVY
ncbi:MAG: hypothetical protein IKJ55_00235, partial [Clostridia bacterium]|nr:hypothetical protein [Clostridia bacterium]